jgi:hypothetical protein
MSYYYENLPEKIPQALMGSFATAFVVRSVIRSDPKLGLIAGAVSMSATLIHALVTPLFKNANGNFDSLTWNQEMARGSMAIIGAGYVSKALGHSNPFEYLFIDVALHAFRIHMESIHLDLRNSNVIVLFPSIPSIPSLPA